MSGAAVRSNTREACSTPDEMKKAVSVRAVSAPEMMRDNLLTPGPSFDGGPFALDLYRLLCMVLADRRIAALTDELADPLPPEQQLQDRYRGSEVIRILASSAVALRILFDQHSRALKTLPKRSCGTLWPRWPEGKRKPEVLTLREACNKIIHAWDIKDDPVIPHRKTNPDMAGLYIRPHVFLHGTKDNENWRAKLLVVDLARHAAVAFLYFTRTD
jgi:hypothetical protein